MKIILASSSPRRRELLKQIGLDFEIMVPECEENFDNLKTIDENLKIISHNKALDVYRKCIKNNECDNNIIISCDTVVVKDGRIFTKPVDEKDAYDMLLNLSGSMHEVKSCITVMDSKKQVSEIINTKVYFNKLSKEEIKWYINTGEPFDKAGGYGIQGKGSVFVKYIEGCYYNVVGLSVNTLYSILRKEFAYCYD